MDKSISNIIAKLADDSRAANAALYHTLEHPVLALDIISTLEELEIKGIDIYILYSDLSNKDIKLMHHLCETVPHHILKDACSRRNNSGIKLVKPFMPKYHEK